METIITSNTPMPPKNHNHDDTEKHTRFPFLLKSFQGGFFEGVGEKVAYGLLFACGLLVIAWVKTTFVLKSDLEALTTNQTTAIALAKSDVSIDFNKKIDNLQGSFNKLIDNNEQRDKEIISKMDTLASNLQGYSQQSEYILSDVKSLK